MAASDELKKLYIDDFSYFCYTFYMKTAISLSDSLYEKAEETASYMGIPRSKLYAMALEEFLSRNYGKMITEKINEVYEKIDTEEFEPYQNAALESIRNLTKNDTW